MANDFTRSLGFEPGVQLNPTVDNSEGFAVNAVEEQSFACAVRLPRGPINRAFSVNKANVLKLTGRPESVNIDELNKGHSQLIEALSNGAKRAVVSRLVANNAKAYWIMVSGEDFENQTSSPDLDESSDFTFALKHLGCFNDGIKFEISAKEKLDETGNAIPTNVITLKIKDSKDVLLDEFTGPLDPTSTDEEGYPNHLGAIIEKYAHEDYEFVSKKVDIKTTSKAYGKDENGIQRAVKTPVLESFTEGDKYVITSEVYKKSVKQLEDTDLPFVYLATLSSISTELCSQLAQLAFNKNITLEIDVPSDFTPRQAIAWVNQLGIQSHLVSFLWHPVECNDPSGVSGRVKLGTSGLRTAFKCAKNARINALGFSPKQYVVSGRHFPIQRQAMKQMYKPNADELSDLAQAGITPVIYQSYSSIGAYVFADAITRSGKATSYLNLVSSVEIVTTLERNACRIAKEFLLFMPMDEAIKRAYQMISQHFEDAKTSGWLVLSEELGGKAFELQIRKNAQRPADVMNIDFRIHPEGCVRQVHITSEITR